MPDLGYLMSLGTLYTDTLWGYLNMNWILRDSGHKYQRNFIHSILLQKMRVKHRGLKNLSHFAALIPVLTVHIGTRMLCLVTQTTSLARICTRLYISAFISNYFFSNPLNSSVIFCGRLFLIISHLKNEYPSEINSRKRYRTWLYEQNNGYPNFLFYN
jgi:hypothetical protein